MNYGAIKGSLMILKARCDGGAPSQFGFSPVEYKLLAGDAPWIGADRPRVRAMLETLVTESTDAIGLPRFTLPGEYVAAVLAVFVSPVNLMVACSWMEGRLPAADMLIAEPDPPPGMEKLSGSQLFAMVATMLGDEDIAAIADKLRKHIMNGIGKINA